MRELAARFAAGSTLPIMLDSTEPGVVAAGLEALGGRCVVNSVNFEDGDGPTSRYARVMPIIREHGAAVVALTIDEEGQARTADWKLQVAGRLIEDLTGRWGLALPDILVDCLTFPISTGQEETRRDGIETINAMREIALDMVYDRRRDGYDPLQRFIEVFEGVDAASARASRAEELAALPLDERLKRRIIDGERVGLTDDLDSALASGRSSLAIINDTLLDGMKVVGELFGSGQM